MRSNNTPLFRNRREAAELLVEQLQYLKGEQGVVLAILRGGVPVGAVIADGLGWPFDIVLAKKIGHPVNPEYAVGAVSLEGAVIDPGTRIPSDHLEREVLRIREELKEKKRKFRGDHPDPDLKGQTVLLVDDGVATGQTMKVTVQLVRAKGAERVIVAMPVAPPGAVALLKEEADEGFMP